MARIITDYLDETVIKYGNSVAYIDEDGTVTFDELRNRAQRLAVAIVEQGLFKQPVIVFMDKSINSVIAFLGVAYSGNFYTPIDPNMPQSRIRRIVDQLEPAIIITDGRNYDKSIAVFDGNKVVILEEVLSRDDVEGDLDNITKKIIDTDLLYVLFTSGSTGIPKGVTISHRSVIDYIDWFENEFGMNDDTVLGNQAPLYFDLSIQDVYLPLKTGCCTVLIPNSLFSFPSRLMNYMLDRGVNAIVWVPTALCVVANMKGLRSRELPELRDVLFCGEVMPNKQLNVWRKAYPNTRFVNMYGPTEACDACAYYIVDREFADSDPLPIGMACNNTDIIVLDENDCLVNKQDVIGELCIRGSSLSYGYYNDNLKTSESFVRNPVNKKYHEVIYRTGDLVKYNEHRELMFVSRKDYQIKRRGYRIELGEIETMALMADNMGSCCCVYNQQDQRIVLYYDGDAKSSEIESFLRKILPDYMIPDRIIHLDKVPHNINGKIDRAALAEMS